MTHPNWKKMYMLNWRCIIFTRLFWKCMNFTRRMDISSFLDFYFILSFLLLRGIFFFNIKKKLLIFFSIKVHETRPPYAQLGPKVRLKNIKLRLAFNRMLISIKLTNC